MSYGATAYEAYQEIAATACTVAALHRVGDDGWVLHQAVCGALLVRISKYMLSICKLGHGEEHGETMFALTRCVTESAINLQFLLSKNDPRYFERFVDDGLRAERELYKQITDNTSDRGGKYLAIERNMMTSIENVFRKSQLSLDDEPKRGVSLGSYESRLRHLGLQDLYLALQRIGSHSIHGTWGDLVLYHLDHDGQKFHPNFGHAKTRGKLFTLPAVIVAKSISAYLSAYFEPDEVEPLQTRLKQLQNSLAENEYSQPDWEVSDASPTVRQSQSPEPPESKHSTRSRHLDQTCKTLNSTAFPISSGPSQTTSSEICTSAANTATSSYP